MKKLLRHTIIGTKAPAERMAPKMLYMGWTWGDRRRRNFPFYRDDGVRGFDAVERQNGLTPASRRNDPGPVQMLQSLFGSRKGKTNECGEVGI